MTRLATAADKEALYVIADEQLRRTWPDDPTLALDRESFFNQFDDPGIYILCNDDATAFLTAQVYPAKRVWRVVMLMPDTMSGPTARELIHDAFIAAKNRTNMKAGTWRVAAILKKQSAVEMRTAAAMVSMYAPDVFMFTSTDPVGIAVGIGPDEVIITITAAKLAAQFGVSL